MPSGALASTPDTLTVKGRVRLLTCDRQWRQVAPPQEWTNVITTAGKQVILHLLGSDGVNSAGGQYLAVGTGVGTPAAGDTALFAELARLPITQATVSSGQVLLQTYFTSLQANGTWTEAGLWGGGNATATVNSGTLIGHVALAYTKTTLIQTILQYTVTLA